MSKPLLILCLLFIIYSSIAAIVVDDFICKTPTCRAFYLGLRHLPRYKFYEETCYDTVFALQAIPRKHGECINLKTNKLHPPCIYALAETIKKCISQLHDLSDHQARFYCGYTLMKHCAVHLGLDGYPLKFNTQNHDD